VADRHGLGGEGTRAQDARQRISESPWRDLEPQPGDFDPDLATIDPRYDERHRGDPDGKLRILLTVEREDARRLHRIDAARGQKPTDVVAELLPAADRSWHRFQKPALTRALDLREKGCPADAWYSVYFACGSS
jgi:hypothetical protein